MPIPDSVLYHVRLAGPKFPDSAVLITSPGTDVIVMAMCYEEEMSAGKNWPVCNKNEREHRDSRNSEPCKVGNAFKPQTARVSLSLNMKVD